MLEDVGRFNEMEDVWASVSDALGPTGAARLVVACRGHEKGPGLVVSLSGLRALLRRECGLTDLSAADVGEVLAPQLDPAGSGGCTLDHLALCVAAHRRRRAARAWTRITPTLAPFPTGLEVVLAVRRGAAANTSRAAVPATAASLSYEEVVAGLSEGLGVELTSGDSESKETGGGAALGDAFPAGAALGAEQLQALLFDLDPTGRGRVGPSDMEVAVDLFRRRMDFEARVCNDAANPTRQRRHAASGGSAQLGGHAELELVADYLRALQHYSSKWGKELVDLSTGAEGNVRHELKAGQQAYATDMRELVAANGAATGVVEGLLRDCAAAATGASGAGAAEGRSSAMAVARAGKARRHLRSRRLRGQLLRLLERERDLSHVYLSARGFRIQGTALPEAERAKREACLSDIRRLVAALQVVLARSRLRPKQSPWAQFLRPASAAPPLPPHGLFLACQLLATFDPSEADPATAKYLALSQQGAQKQQEAQQSSVGGLLAAASQAMVAWEDVAAERLWLSLAEAMRKRQMATAGLVNALKALDDGR